MSKKILLFFICIVTITLNVGCKKTYTIENISKEMLVQKTTNIYSEPSEESSVLGRLLTSEIINITGTVKENGWYRISYNGSDAYIYHGDLTDVIPPVLPEQPNPTPSDTKEVKNLTIASTTNQIIMVAANGSRATLSMYTKKENGSWETTLFTENCYIGMNGLGKTKEGDKKTPVGAFHFTKAFGIKSNPGTQLEYIQVNDSHYWVDDSNSNYYNQFVSTDNVNKNWSSAEHIIEYSPTYNYCLALDYNDACEPGKGSAIFLHCINLGETTGCIAIPEEIMIKVLKNVNENCVIIIDTETNIWNY